MARSAFKLIQTFYIRTYMQLTCWLTHLITCINQCEFKYQLHSYSYACMYRKMCKHYSWVCRDCCESLQSNTGKNIDSRWAAGFLYDTACTLGESRLPTPMYSKIEVSKLLNAEKTPGQQWLNSRKHVASYVLTEPHSCMGVCIPSAFNLINT